jgi:hypothetical protein
MLDLAERIFIVGGVLSIAYGFLLGIPLSSVRMQASEAPRHLVVAHLAAIIQGAMHLGLSVAARFSTLPTGLEALSALLLVGGSALFVSGATANWLQGIGDHFAKRSLGWKLLAVSGFLNIGGISILLLGVLLAL